MFNFTVSSTKTPPASNALFQLRPKSFLLIFPVNSKATLLFPQGSIASPLFSKLSFTSLVIPLIESFPYAKSPSILSN